MSMRDLTTLTRRLEYVVIGFIISALIISLTACETITSLGDSCDESGFAFVSYQRSLDEDNLPNHRVRYVGYYLAGYDGPALTCDNIGEVMSVAHQNSGLRNLDGLEDLVRVEALHLEGNQITDISGMRTLTHLHGIDLAHNPLADISPLLANGHFTSAVDPFVDLYQTNVPCEQIQQLENLGVRVRSGC